MMFGRDEEALAFAEPLVPNRHRIWLRVLPQRKNEKLPNSNRDNWVQYFCPYFTTEGLLRQAWDDTRRVGGADGRKLVRIVTAWRVEGQFLVWSAELETPLGLATGHATANLGENAKGVDAKNPFENGETSAIGRALRHLGYGFGFETDDEASVREAADGRTDQTHALPGNGHSTDKSVSGRTGTVNERPSNAAGVPSSGAPERSQPRTEAPKAASAGGDGHGPVVDFNQLRNEVLTPAWRLSSTSKQDIAGVVSRASYGSFQYSDIGRMTSADLPKLQAAVLRLGEAVNQPKG